MSSGPFIYSLSAAAAFAMRSLMEPPQLQTPEEIASAPAARDQIDADGERGGLEELARHRLAAEDRNGRWRLTDAGREAERA